MARRSSDHISIALEHGIDIPARTIYLTSYADGTSGDEAGIDWQMADRVLKGLRLLGSGELPITLIINNIGGEDDHARAIIGAIRQCPVEVHGIVYGRAESAAAWILQACDHRAMDSHSSIMLHMGSSEKNHHQDYIDSLFIDDVLAKMREKDPGLKRSALIRKLKQDWNVYPQEALSLGLIDEIL